MLGVVKSETVVRGFSTDFDTKSLLIIVVLTFENSIVKRELRSDDQLMTTKRRSTTDVPPTVKDYHSLRSGVH